MLLKVAGELDRVDQAADGDATDSGNDVLHPSNQVAEAVDQDPELMDALRPVYLEYLRKHPKA